VLRGRGMVVRADVRCRHWSSARRRCGSGNASRKRSGKAGHAERKASKASMTPERLVKAFKEDTERKRMMIKRTEATRNRLVFVVEALSQLSHDETFGALLEDEGLATLPSRLAERINLARAAVP